MSKAINVVETSGRLACDKQKAWEKVCFYEQVRIKPSLLLRIVLPIPLETTGSYQKVGDMSRCKYSDDGYLTKKITRLDECERIDFDIVEQSIRFHRNIKLLGGTIRIIGHDDGTSSVQMTTRYTFRHRPFHFPRFFVGLVIKAMHRIVIRDMQIWLAGAATEREVTVYIPQSNKG